MEREMADTSLLLHLSAAEMNSSPETIHHSDLNMNCQQLWPCFTHKGY